MTHPPVRILLVEDSPSDAALVRESLALDGLGPFTLTQAACWAEAVAHLDREAFDVLLLDLTLPDSTGPSTFLRARAVAPHLPIVLLTGVEDEAVGLEAIRHGIQDYLTKGQADGRQTARAIHYAIERKRAELELQRVRDELEMRVQTRTAALKEMVGSLQAEIIHRKQAEKHLEGVAALLKLFTAKFSRREYLEGVVRLLADWCSCCCAGIRLLDEQGRLPYAAQVGFSRRFLKHERELRLADAGGCACVRVLLRRPLPEDAACSSPNGSLFCNQTSRCVAHLGVSPAEQAAVACVHEGYESLAHAPIRYRDQLLGTLHLADHGGGKFPAPTIAFIEAIAPLVGEAIHRFKVEDSLITIGEKERQRIGQDLHDTLGGRLAGTALMSKALAQTLAANALPEAALAEEIVQCTNESIAQTRSIARGLYPVELSLSGLAGGLEQLATETRRRSGIECSFKWDKKVRIEDPYAATHLFRLAQEALNNALRHGQPSRVSISLTQPGEQLVLEICDDGTGLPRNLRATQGLGLQTMKYRADALGGELSVKPGKEGGTVVACVLPAARAPGAETKATP